VPPTNGDNFSIIVWASLGDSLYIVVGVIYLLLCDYDL